MDKVTMRMTELADYCREYACEKREALLEMLFDFYECAGFDTEVLEKELKSMSEEKRGYKGLCCTEPENLHTKPLWHVLW